jgi:hypothetical protein
MLSNKWKWTFKFTFLGTKATSMAANYWIFYKEIFARGTMHEITVVLSTYLFYIWTTHKWRYLEVLRSPPSWINFLSSFGDVTTGINHIKVFVANQILIGIDVLKVLSDLDISKGRQSIVLSARWLVVV